MNWFTKLFVRRNANPTAQEERTNPSITPSQDGVTTSAPTQISTNKQPLSVLKKFAPLRDMDEIFIDNLEQQTLRFDTGAILFNRGEARSAVFYLLEGSVEMQPDSNSSYLLQGGSVLANLPLSSGKKFGATAVAKTSLKILAIPGKIIHMWTDKSRAQVFSVKQLELELPKEFANNRFFSSFSDAYRKNRLSLPSLPHVAIKLKKAMQSDVGVKEVVDIIQVDAPIVTKLLQIANSSLYSMNANITNCHDAVSRLGLNTTRNLVMGIGMKQLFSCKDPSLVKMMQSFWKSSLYISSLSYVLAEESGSINPEDALLAGLVSNIGVIPILHFAEQYPEEYPDTATLSAALQALNPSVGALVLHTLGFPEDLIRIPMHAEDWLYESEGEAMTIIDIVIMAKLHSLFGTPRAKSLPYINSIPAYSKLKNSKLTPDFSLDVLDKAHKRIKTVMKLFS